MLRAVLSEVEVVRSSSSNLRWAAVACGHLFELAGGSSAAAVRTVAFPRPKVDRKSSRNWDAVVLLRQVDRAAIASGAKASGAGPWSTSVKVRACQGSGPNRRRPASGPRRQSCQRRSRPTRRLQRTLTAVSSYNGLRSESLRGAFGACGQAPLSRSSVRRPGKQRG
jgi:hypothetical protein